MGAKPWTEDAHENVGFATQKRKKGNRRCGAVRAPIRRARAAQPLGHRASAGNDTECDAHGQLRLEIRACLRGR